MNTYEYIWKIGVEPVTGRRLKTTKPLVENAVLTDLYTGNRYLIQIVFDVQPTDQRLPYVPRRGIQTWPVGSIGDDELKRLRELANYTPGYYSGPLDDMVFP